MELFKRMKIGGLSTMTGKAGTIGNHFLEKDFYFMKTTCFGDLPVGNSFLFRGQIYKKWDTSLARDWRLFQLIFDRDTQVEAIRMRKRSRTPQE
jgi:hypothetical protein